MFVSETICATLFGNMARIYNRKDIWYIDYKFKGRRYRKKIGTSNRLAEAALKDIEIKIIRDELGFSKTDIKIESLIQKFLEYNRTNHRASTTKRYKAVTDHFRRFLLFLDLYPIIFTFLNIGMRKSELENLLWADIDFERRRILIRAKDGWKPKTRDQEIPMSEDVVQVLSDVKKGSRSTAKDEYTFPCKNTGHSHNWLRTEFVKLAHKAGIEELTYRPLPSSWVIQTLRQL